LFCSVLFFASHHILSATFIESGYVFQVCVLPFGWRFVCGSDFLLHCSLRNDREFGGAPESQNHWAAWSNQDKALRRQRPARLEQRPSSGPAVTVSGLHGSPQLNAEYLSWLPFARVWRSVAEDRDRHPRRQRQRAFSHGIGNQWSPRALTPFSCIASVVCFASSASVLFCFDHGLDF
jgi:hypothetical protein